MRAVKICMAVLAFVILSLPALAGLSSQDVVVVYNNSTLTNGNYDWSVSESVADYYCAARGIPSSNKFGVTFPYGSESTSPVRFHNLIETPLRTFLSSRPGFVENDPGTDPTKAIVLCLGVPILVDGGGITCSVDGSLSLLFNQTDWGHLPLAGYPTWQTFFGTTTMSIRHNAPSQPVSPTFEPVHSTPLPRPLRASPSCAFSTQRMPLPLANAVCSIAGRGTILSKSGNGPLSRTRTRAF